MKETIAVGEEVFVVMGNDFPHSVYTERESAEKACVRLREECLERYNRQLGEGHGRRPIYYRVYDFKLRGEG